MTERVTSMMPFRKQAISRLIALGVAEDAIAPLSKYVPPERADAVRTFGESVPPGLDLIGSNSCLLSIPAFSSSSDFVTGTNGR